MLVDRFGVATFIEKKMRFEENEAQTVLFKKTNALRYKLIYFRHQSNNEIFFSILKLSEK